MGMGHSTLLYVPTPLLSNNFTSPNLSSTSPAPPVSLSHSLSPYLSLCSIKLCRQRDFPVLSVKSWYYVSLDPYLSQAEVRHNAAKIHTFKFLLYNNSFLLGWIVHETNPRLKNKSGRHQPHRWDCTLH